MTAPSESRAGPCVAAARPPAAAGGSSRCDVPRRATRAGAALAAAVLAGHAQAHGVVLQARTLTAVELTAMTDGGAPLAGAQVVVHAPGADAPPFAVGITDAEGRFRFVADPERPGAWTAEVRDAGHGATAQLHLGGDDRAAPPAPDAPAGLLQRLVMVALAIWGALGTALFFRRRAGGDASA